VEGVLFTGLVGAGGDPAQVAAAVLVYRALTWALPILVGIGCYSWWRRRTWTATPQDTRHPAREAAPSPGEATMTTDPHPRAGG
jgi:putative heme transporter